MTAGSPPELGYRTKRWTLEEYHRLLDLGAFAPEVKVELVDGEIVEKMSAKPPHSNTVAQLGDILARLFGSGFHAREEKPVTIVGSEPEPDVAVIVGTRAGFFARHPGSEDIALVVEVSDTTLPFDRGQKASLYARAGVRELWIADLNGRRLLIHRGPMPDGTWTEVVTYGPESRVRPLAADGELLVADLLPPLPPEEAQTT